MIRKSKDTCICRDSSPFQGLPSLTPSPGSPSSSLELTFVEYGQWLLSLGLLYASNKGLAKATAAAGISFPSPLIGTAQQDKLHGTFLLSTSL